MDISDLHAAPRRHPVAFWKSWQKMTPRRDDCCAMTSRRAEVGSAGCRNRHRSPRRHTLRRKSRQTPSWPDAATTSGFSRSAVDDVTWAWMTSSDMTSVNDVSNIQLTYFYNTPQHSIGVGDGGQGGTPPPPKKNGKKILHIFSGNYHVKFGHFTNFYT